MGCKNRFSKKCEILTHSISIYPAFIASDKDKYPPLREKQPPFEFSCKKRAVYKFDDLKHKDVLFSFFKNQEQV